jgi:ribonuclease Z
MDNATPSPTVLLFFDQERYLFNVGEGMQRQLRENKVNLRRLNHLLFSRLSNTALGGLPGFLLSLNPDAKGAGGGAEELLGAQHQPKMHLIGPAGMSAYVDVIRMYAAGNTSRPDVAEVAGERVGGTPRGMSKE